MTEIGLAAQRIRMINISAAMGPQFVQAATEMTATISDLGPNPLRENRGGSNR